jgi:hypothetical protein
MSCLTSEEAFACSLHFRYVGVTSSNMLHHLTGTKKSAINASTLSCSFLLCGGAYETRTRDPNTASVVRSQTVR